jgi:hypothetical protein
MKLPSPHPIRGFATSPQPDSKVNIAGAWFPAQMDTELPISRYINDSQSGIVMIEPRRAKTIVLLANPSAILK